MSERVSAGLPIGAVLDRLRESGLTYRIVDMADSEKLVVLERGGRIFPFLTEPNEKEPTCALWMNPCFSESGAFRNALLSGEWNMGGERVWIAPEMQYCIKDRTRIPESWELPSAMDPGCYTLSDGEGWGVLDCSMELKAYNLAKGTRRLAVKRSIRKADNPLSSLAEYKRLMEGVSYRGYEHIIMLTDMDSTGGSEIVSEPWVIMQLHQGGRMHVPVFGTPEYAWYYDPRDASILRFHGTTAELDCSRSIKYKIGFKAPHIAGRAGYCYPRTNGTCILIIRNFYCNPSGTYAEEPFHKPGDGGYPFHVYNDDGVLGAFCELEVNGPGTGKGDRDIVDEKGRDVSITRMSAWFFSGEMKRLYHIMSLLLGVG